MYWRLFLAFFKNVFVKIKITLFYIISFSRFMNLF